MVYTVVIASRVEFTETTIAACKALVSGLDCGWTIHASIGANVVGIVKGPYANSKPMPFQLGNNFSVEKSKEFLKKFKRSRMEKELNNTTYISCEKFQMEMWEKKWGKMQEISV